MSNEIKVSGQQLEDAFALFNTVSDKLAKSYSELETRVAHLTDEQAKAHDERLEQLLEKDRLTKRLEGLLDTLPAGIIVLDADGLINQTNPIAEEMLGGQHHGMSWQTLAITVLSHDSDELRLADGRWVSITARPLDAEPGSIILITDITERYTLQNMLSHQQRLTSLGEMVASLAHQIRTPLSSALLYLSNITHPNANSEDRTRFTGKMRERLHHLERLVSNMLVFARGGTNTTENFSVKNFVIQLQQMLEPLLTKSNASLTIDNHANDAELNGNSDALLGVLQNLACNAIEACNDTPRLAITISVDALKMVEFQIRDNGSGIPANIRERILEPFFTTRNSGTGLGLAVVNETVHSFNGVIDVESEEGVGSCFRIRLPLANSDEVMSQDMLPGNIINQDINVCAVYVNKYLNNESRQFSHV